MRIDLVNVAMSFGPTRLFDNLQHTFHPGSMTALTGPSGSGKSTVLGIIAGAITPTLGHVVHSPRPVQPFWVLQQPRGLPERSAQDHVRLPLLAHGSSRGAATKRAQELLALCSVVHCADQPFRELSGGESQRVLLARAMAADPPVLLIDEPTASLDRVTSESIVAVLRAMRHARRIVVVATHDPLVVAALPERLSLEQSSA